MAVTSVDTSRDGEQRVRVRTKPIPLSSLTRLHGAWAMARHPALRESRLMLGPGAELLIAPEADLRVGRGLVARRDLTLSVQGRLRVGRRLFCNRGVMIAAMREITVGDDVRLGERVSIIDHNHVLEPLDDLDGRYNEYLCEPVEIGDRVLIGAGSVILPGSRIGDDAVIGAGAVVTGEVRAGTLALGSPASEQRDLRRSAAD